MADWETLAGVKTSQELVDEAKTFLRTEASPLIVDPSWGVFYSFVKVCAWLLRLAWLRFAALLPNVFASETSDDDFADLHAADVGKTRTPARKARWRITFERDDSAGALAVSGTWLSTPLDGDGAVYRFRRIEDATAADGAASIDVLFEAEFAGSAYNVGEETITVMESAFSGWDRATNLSRLEDEFETLDTAGLDLETTASLMSRRLAAWQDEGLLPREEVYVGWVRAVAPNALVQVLAGMRGPGTVNLVVSGDTGPAPQSLIDEIQSYVDQHTMLTEDVAVVTYAGDPVDVEAVLYVAPYTPYSTKLAMQALAEQTVRDMFSLTSGSVRRFAMGENVRLDRIRAAVFAALAGSYGDWFTRMTFADPVADVAVASGHRAVLSDLTLTVAEEAEL